MTLKRWLAVGVTVVLVGGLAVALLVLRARAPLPQTADVGVPRDDASPEQVVRAYVAALDAHDCDTAVAIRGSSRDVCEDLRSLTLESVRADQPGPGDLDTRVEISADFEWRTFRVDPSLIGPSFWGYRLARRAPGAPWRIVGDALPG